MYSLQWKSPPHQEGPDYEPRYHSLCEHPRVRRCKLEEHSGTSFLGNSVQGLLGPPDRPADQPPSLGWERPFLPFSPDGWNTGQSIPDASQGASWSLVPGDKGPGWDWQLYPSISSLAHTPQGIPAARLLPQWHVTNGDMFLLSCLVRSEVLMDIETAGDIQILVSQIERKRKRERERDRGRGREIDR